MKKHLFFLSIPVVLALNAVAQDKWDLKRCVEYAVTNNISVKQADVQARLAKLTLDQSKLTQIPTLIFQGSGQINSGRSQNLYSYGLNTQTTFQNNLSLQSGVTLFNGFSIQRTIDANRYAWQAMLASSDKLKNDISLNVANAYLQVLLLDQTAQTALLQMHLSQNQLVLTQKQVQAGTLPELNAAELESQVAQDSSNYITAKSNAAQAILNLKAYMALDAAAPFEVDKPPVENIPVEPLADLQPDAVYSLALTHQPLQKMDALNIQADSQFMRAARGAMSPVVSLFAGVGSAYTNVKGVGYNRGPFTDTIGVLAPVLPINNQFVVAPTAIPYPVKANPYFSQLNNAFGQSVGVSVNIPIFNQGVLRTGYNRSKLNLRNQQLQRDQDNLTLKNNIYQAYTLAVAALEKFNANKITVAATAKSFDYAQKRYNVGMSNTIDLLTNQNNYFNAQVNLLYAQYDYVFKMKVLEYYKGMGIRL